MPAAVRAAIDRSARRRSRAPRYHAASCAMRAAPLSHPVMRFPELGIYLLPGHTDSPADALAEVQAAEALGLGSAWVSERFDVKEVGAVCGAAAAVTREIWIGTGVTNVDTRHPLLLATLATTL